MALALALLAPSLAEASNASFGAALATWSHRIGVDAGGIGLSAVHRHPRRLTVRAARFRTDAQRARHTLSAIAVSSTRGRRAKQLALAAFGQYALVGRFWALAGRARVAHHKLAATRDARLAAAHGKRGGLLLIKASKLLH